jgi:hypothetical protein
MVKVLPGKTTIGPVNKYGLLAAVQTVLVKIPPLTRVCEFASCVRPINKNKKSFFIKFIDSKPIVLLIVLAISYYKYLIPQRLRF